ncbi:MAG TPA: thioredoxin domain-containing protein [Candidatus Limnocylindrales bacterium]
MTSKAPGEHSTAGSSQPPTIRRSARQQRLRNREANRALARAGTRGSSGSGSPLMLYTLGALVIAAVVIGAAFWWTSQPKAKAPLHAPIAPAGSAVTSSSIPENGMTLGQADAKHTIDVYEDYQCPNCRDFTVDVEPQVVANYVANGRAKLVWHDFIVIDGNTGGTESLDAANASHCANDQGQFWLMHDWLYANQYGEGSGAYTKDRLKAIGKAAGIKDLTKFNTCVDAGSHNEEIANETLPDGAKGTPSIAIDGALLATFDYATVSAALDKALGVTPSPSVSPSSSPSSSPSVSPASSVSPSVKPS